MSSDDVQTLNALPQSVDSFEQNAAPQLINKSSASLRCGISPIDTMHMQWYRSISECIKCATINTVAKRLVFQIHSRTVKHEQLHTYTRLDDGESYIININSIYGVFEQDTHAIVKKCTNRIRKLIRLANHRDIRPCHQVHSNTLIGIDVDQHESYE